jgi:hypothetical protein
VNNWWRIRVWIHRKDCMRTLCMVILWRIMKDHWIMKMMMRSCFLCWRNRIWRTLLGFRRTWRSGVKIINCNWLILHWNWRSILMVCICKRNRHVLIISVWSSLGMFRIWNNIWIRSILGWERLGCCWTLRESLSGIRVYLISVFLWPKSIQSLLRKSSMRAKKLINLE